jgi:ABC-type multidrug transport system ATPase subunit
VTAAPDNLPERADLPERRVVLSARDASIEVDGTIAVSSLDVTTRGDRVMLVGSTSPLLAVLAGAMPRSDEPAAAPVTARVVAGDLAVLERSVSSGAHRGVCGVALSDPPLPWRWTVGEYLIWAARLDGAGRKASKILVSSALGALSLTAIARTRLRALSALERRVVVLASAIVSQPAAVVVDDPFGGLDDRDASLMLGALGRALYGRAAIVSVPRIRLTDPTGELAKTTTDILLMRGGSIVVHTSPVELLSRGRLYELTVRAQADALRTTLAEQGLTLAGGPHHFSLILPEEMGPKTVLAAAARARAPITSCMPLIG